MMIGIMAGFTFGLLVGMFSVVMRMYWLENRK